MMTYYASMLAMGYYILTGIFTIAFMRKLYYNYAILLNLMILQIVQLLAALIAAAAYALEGDLIFSLWWGVITCMSIAAVRMSYNRVKRYRQALADKAQLRAKINELINQVINLRSSHENNLDK